MSIMDLKIYNFLQNCYDLNSVGLAQYPMEVKIPTWFNQPNIGRHWGCQTDCTFSSDMFCDINVIFKIESFQNLTHVLWNSSGLTKVDKKHKSYYGKFIHSERYRLMR